MAPPPLKQDATLAAFELIITTLNEERLALICEVNELRGLNETYKSQIFAPSANGSDARLKQALHNTQSQLKYAKKANKTDTSVLPDIMFVTEDGGRLFPERVTAELVQAVADDMASWPK